MNSRSVLSAGTHFLTVLGVNAVPALGVFAGGWPAETAMLVYLLETFTMVTLSALRVRLLAPAHEETGGDPLEPAPPLLAPAQRQPRRLALRRCSTINLATAARS